VNNNDFNAFVAQVSRLKRQGFTPQAVMNMMLQQNPQLQTALTQMKNMSQGRSPQEFVAQLCRQQGIDFDGIMKNF